MKHCEYQNKPLFTVSEHMSLSKNLFNYDYVLAYQWSLTTRPITSLAPGH